MAVKMSVATIDKFISDILECVGSLKEQFEDERVPLTDDNIFVQKLCSKLEFILQHGLKDRTSILGNKKDYWDYVCQCLASRKYIHDGIRYVKLNSDVKTSKGKGRAFLRFCLVHSCLADSLQQCFVHDATRDWYYDWSLPLHRDKWSPFISSLYDLSEISFDLSPDCFDLDINWPTFSRRSHDSRFSWRPPSRSVSISSLNSQIQMEHPLGFAAGSDFPECQEEEDLEQAADQMESDRFPHSQIQNQQLLQSSQDTVDGVPEQAEERCTAEELVKCQSLVAHFEDENAELQKSLSDCQIQLQTLLSEKEQMATVIHESETRVKQLEEINSHLNADLTALKADVESGVTEVEKASKTVGDLQVQLSECENQVQQAETERRLFQVWLEKMQGHEEEGEECRTCQVQSKDNFGDLEISELKTKLKDACDILTKTEEERNVLKKSIASMSALQSKLEDGNVSEEKLIEAQKLIQDLESKVKELCEKIPDVSLVSKLTDLEMSNISLSQELQSVSNNFQCRITSLYSEKDELSQTIQKLEERNQHLVLQVQEKKEALSKANKQIGQLEQVRSVLGPLYGQQETMASELNQKSSDLIFASEKLSSEMKTLASILFCIARGNYVTWEPKEEEEASPERSQSEMEPSMDPVSSSVLVPLVCNNARTISKMKDLLKKNERVEMIIQTCDVLCRDLIGLAREHKKKLALQHFDLQGTQHVVDTLTKEHKKLQTAEAILKYELKEKKKLLTSLRHQVESTREEWNRNKLKTAQSEIEWHNLREEFAARHKQSSEESGFVDDRRSESATSESITDDQNTDENLSDQSEMSSGPPCENASDEIVTGDGFQATTTKTLAVPFSSPSSSGKEQDTCTTTTTTTSVPRSRLDLLEEQYQLLYSSLVRSSKRSEVLEQRLEALLGNAESYTRSRANRSTPSQEIPEESASDVPLLSDVAEPDMTSPSEDLSQSSISLENGLDSDNGVLDVAVSEESLDSESSNVLFNGDGLHSYEVQTMGDDANGNVATIPEPMSDIRKRTLENFVTRLKDEKMARNAKEADLRTEIQVLLAEKIELENKILCLQQEKQHVWSKESEFRKRAEFIFRQERDSFESKLSSLSQERMQSANKVEETKAKLAESQDQQRKLEQILKERQRELSEKEASLNSQIEMLKFQMSTEAIKYERALKHYNEQESGILDMREKMNSQEKVIEALEESMLEIKEERRLEREQQWHELEELQVSLSTRDEECSAMNEDLKKTMRELDETRNLYANLLSASNQAEREHCITISRLETVLAQMKTDNESLKREIIKLINDKDALWKRTEALSQRQFSPTRDRWMADSEVTECLGCKSTFSFTLRKHHCRLCGRIFCHNCANHWVMMASSSRRTRICTECYSDHIDKTTAKQVSLPADQEGSEEDPPETTPEVVPIRAPANSSFDSSSVDSLPASSRRDSSPSVMEALAEDESHKNSLCEEDNSNLDESFLTKSSRMDFDVISDEEIARSLSACSPYSPVPSPVSGAEPEVQTTGTRTIQDIVSCGPDGVSGEIWVNAGGSYAVPVILDQEEVILSWEFTSDPKSIAFSVTYKEENSHLSSQEVLLQTNRVESDLRPAQGHLIAKHPGLYSLVFNNQFSRYMAKKVSYTLKILNLKDGNVQNEDST